MASEDDSTRCDGKFVEKNRDGFCNHDCSLLDPLFIRGRLSISAYVYSEEAAFFSLERIIEFRGI
jgi:hypothetical protein